MLNLVQLAQATLVAALRSRRGLFVENLLLRHQLQVALRSRRRPRLRTRRDVLLSSPVISSSTPTLPECFCRGPAEYKTTAVIFQTTVPIRRCAA